MLVLSRKPNEEILIGDNIKVTVLKVKGNTVRIGIEAPAAVKVKRGELPDNRPAGATAGNGLVLNQDGERAEIELTLSFSPTEEGVSAGKESPAKREHAEVLKFEPAATKTRRSKATASPNQASQRLVSMPAADAVDRAQGTNRIKEILSRIVPGLPVNGLSVNSLPSDDLADE